MFSAYGIKVRHLRHSCGGGPCLPGPCLPCPCLPGPCLGGRSSSTSLESSSLDSCDPCPRSRESSRDLCSRLAGRSGESSRESCSRLAGPCGIGGMGLRVPSNSSPASSTHQHSPRPSWHWVDLKAPSSVHSGTCGVSAIGTPRIRIACCTAR